MIIPTLYGHMEMSRGCAKDLFKLVNQIVLDYEDTGIIYQMQLDDLTELSDALGEALEGGCYFDD